MSGKCRFNHAWLQMEKYMLWVKTDEDPGRAKCRLCGGKTFNISNMGEAALTINEPCQRKQRALLLVKLQQPYHRLSYHSEGNCYAEQHVSLVCYQAGVDNRFCNKK